MPTEVKDWQGAKEDMLFCRMAFEAPGTETSNVWLKAVDDDTYAKLQ